MNRREFLAGVMAVPAISMRLKKYVDPAPWRGLDYKQIEVWEAQHEKVLQAYQRAMERRRG